MKDSRLMVGKPGLDLALGQRVYDHVKQRILEGDLEPEDKLSVVALAERLGCSRVPVMEAMKRLEAESLIDIVPQVGCKVAVPNTHDVTDFFMVFANVEGVMAKFAAERRTDDDVVTFQSVCKRVDSVAASAGGATARDPSYRQLNLLFHKSIHQMARSPLASDISMSLWDRADFYIKVAFGSLYFSKRVKRSHIAIKKAIITGDATLAESEMNAHLCAVGDSVAKKLS
ncbi:MAG: GntR family transcriptional regulator [Porticoccaceae bacterium]